jgi:hypothetical protein
MYNLFLGKILVHFCFDNINPFYNHTLDDHLIIIFKNNNIDDTNELWFKYV